VGICADLDGDDEEEGGDLGVGEERRGGGRVHAARVMGSAPLLKSP